MRVRDVMSTAIVEVAATITCEEAAKLMRDRDVGLLIVTKDGRVVEGVISDRDLVVRSMALGADASTHVVGEYMDCHPVTVDADLSLERAIAIMRNACLRRLPVTVSGTRAIGLLSFDDIAVDVKHYLEPFLAVAGQYSRKNR